MREISDAAYRDFCDILFDHKSEAFDERSPITYVKNVENPLCIIASQNDSRTPLKPVLAYISELHKQGVKFEFHMTTDAGHIATSTSQFMDDLLPGIQFLQKHFPV